MAIDTTVEGANANSYADVAYYKAFWGARPFNTTPLAASDSNIELSLMWAALLLDSCFRWNGTATTDTQALCWPRSGLLTRNARSLDKDTLPKQLKDAQCLWAGMMWIDGADRAVDDPDSKVLGTESALTSLTAGPVSLGFDSNRFSTIESFDAYIRSIQSDFNYLSKVVPDSVRLLLVKGWYREANLKRPILAAAIV